VLASTDAVVRGLAASRAPSTTLAEVRALRVPVLVLCGERTRAPLAALTRLLARELAGATWEEVPEAGHMGPLTHPQPVAAHVTAFLLAQESRVGG
jgi:pimeloyl-ACP methyl ester carboxylesterase